MFGGKVEHMLMARIAQEGPPLHTSAQVVDNTGHLAPLGDQAADIEAPVSVEIIHHPVVTMHVWQLLDDMGQMGGKIGTGAGLAQIPHDLTCRDHKRGEQRPGPMTDILVLAFFRFARGERLRGVFALKNLHTGLFIGADDQAALGKETQRVEVQGTNVVGFALKVYIVAVKPIDAAMGFEVRLIENAPDARTTHGPGVTLQQGGDEVVETPACGWAVVRGRFTGGHRHHIQTL